MKKIIANNKEFKTDWWKSLSKIYLNLGGGKYRHSVNHYDNYISVNHPLHYQNMVVDLNTGERVLNKNNTSSGNWRGELPFNIVHDIMTPSPFDDNSVDRILSEDCLEHVDEFYYPSILTEMYRILKPGGIFRLSVPDYRNPKDRPCIEKGLDPANDKHVTITTYDLLKKYTDKSPFEIVEYKHYWKDDDTFVQNEIDYNLGWVKRTPDNDKRNTVDNPLHVTSLVVDLKKK